MSELDNLDIQPLREYAEKAYLDYSMYVIHDRALPHIGDGLKPVQRRIIYAMSQLNLDFRAKYSKSARTIGDVIGKFHPHGEDACYEAMVLMAQPFSFRYPLVDGQGNWGAAEDPKSFAASRYTEARLSRYADLLLAEIGKGAVEYSPNFDGTLQEPQCLPAQVPVVLLNGSTGIAVGMATSVLPHNLGELVNACILLLKKPSTTTEELMSIVLGPDFPTGGLVTSSTEELAEAYEIGRGTIRGRAKYVQEHGDIVITELPYQVSPARLVEKIAQQMQAKRLPMLADIRDESDHENPTRLVLVPRSNRVDTNRVMQHLFATTDLERTYSVNFNVIGLDSRPKVMGLREMLLEWLEFRRRIVRRRIEYRLECIASRLHEIEGLLIAYFNLDEVIRIVREEDDPKAVLTKDPSPFTITDKQMSLHLKGTMDGSLLPLTGEQATAILNLRLRQLARLEEERLIAERNKLATEQQSLQKIVDSTRRMNALIRNELEKVAKEYDDERRTEIITIDDARAYTESELLSNDPITVVLSQKGWVRSAKGHEIDPLELPYRTGDNYARSVRIRTNEACTFFDSMGRAYSVLASSLPSARGQGEPLTGRFNPPAGARFVGLVSGTSGYALLSSTDGYGFVAPLEAVLNRTRNGKSVVNISNEHNLLPPWSIADDVQVAVVSSSGRLLVFDLEALPQLRSGKGVKLINLQSSDDQKETLIQAVTLGVEHNLIVYSGERYKILKSGELAEYRGERARRGKLLSQGFRKIRAMEVDRR